MEQTSLDRWHAPLKAPAIEVIDLLSDDELIDQVLKDKGKLKERDASEDEVDSEGSQSSLWEDVLNAKEEHGPLHGGMKAQPLDLLLAAADIPPDEEACTFEEAMAFRKRLRLIGEDHFLAETVEAGKITAKKLCTAFGIRFPFFLEGQPDETYHYPLRLGICRELSKRTKLLQYNTIDDAVELLNQSKNIIVLTGAGVSTFTSLREL